MKFTKKLYGNAFVNNFIAEMEGQKYNNRPYAWIDPAGNRYSFITGSIAMPTFEYLGYLITAGIRYDDQKIECLHEFETDNEIELVKEAARIKKEYGPAIEMFFGNPRAMMPIVTDMKKPVLISPPIDYDADDAFQLYVTRLQTALIRETKTLIIRDCNILRNNLLAFARDKAARSDNNPVIHAAGSLVHTLLTLRPWEQAVERIELIPTKEDQAYLNEQDEKAIMAELYAVGQ